MHDSSKRSRRSFVADSNYTDNQRDVPKNNSYWKSTTESIEEVVTKLYSSYLSDDEKDAAKNLISNEMNISNSQYSLNRGLFSNNHFANVTITPSANKRNMFGLKYFSSTELYSNDRFIGNKSLFVIETTFRPERITKSDVSKTSSKEISGHSTIEMKTIDHTAENRTNSADIEKNAFTDSIRFSINGDSGKSLKNRNGKEKLGIATQKISRLSTDDGQSEGAEKDFPGEICRMGSASGQMNHGAVSSKRS